MSSLVATLEAIVKAGATPEMMLEVVRVHEAARADALAKRRADDAARQQRQRDKRNHVKSRDVTQTVNGHADSSPRAHVEDTSLPSLRSEEVITPTQNPSGSSPPRKAKSVRRERRVPADWLPSPSHYDLGDAEGLVAGEIERELAKFRDHEFATPHSDWDACFRKWLRTAAERKPRLAHVRPHSDQRRTDREDNLSRALAGAEIASRGGR